jgi:tripeptidyl-peptidase I
MPMMIRSIIVSAVLVGQFIVPALSISYERLTVVPSGWTFIQEAPSDTPITLSVAVARQNLGQLESQLIAVSTPGHPEYGNFVDNTDINTLFPLISDVGITSWLQSAGISNIHSAGDTVNFATTVATANKLLETTFGYYQSGGTIKLRTTQYSIPDYLVGDIELIYPATYFGKTSAAIAIPSVTRKSSNSTPDQSTDAPSCQTSITPFCLKQMYNVNGYVPDPNSGSRIAFGSFLNQSASCLDLTLFEENFNIPLQNFSVELINKGVDNQNPATAQVAEADLDVQYIIGMSHPLPVTEYITGGSPYGILTRHADRG